MSSKLGFRVINTQEEYESLSNATRTEIDEEIRVIADAAYKRAHAILVKHATPHRKLAEALMNYETLDRDDVRVIAEGRTLVKDDPSAKKGGKVPKEGVDGGGGYNDGGHAIGGAIL